MLPFISFATQFSIQLVVFFDGIYSVSFCYYCIHFCITFLYIPLIYLGAFSAPFYFPKPQQNKLFQPGSLWQTHRTKSYWTFGNTMRYFHINCASVTLSPPIFSISSSVFSFPLHVLFIPLSRFIYLDYSINSTHHLLRELLNYAFNWVYILAVG